MPAVPPHTAVGLLLICHTIPDLSVKMGSKGIPRRPYCYSILLVGADFMQKGLLKMFRYFPRRWVPVLPAAQTQ